MLCIENAKVVLENGILWNGAILIEDGRIRWVGDRADAKIPRGTKKIDAGGLYVGPGFVDLHVHAAGKTSLSTDPLAGAEYYLRSGTTSILPTPAYRMTKEQYVEAFDRVRKAMASGGIGKCIVGMYMEGPYINAKYGAASHTSPWQGPIRAEDYEPLVDAAGDLVKVWMVAPEREGILSFVQYAKKKNPALRFSVGHSEATPDQIAALKPYGLDHLTHCMDATGRVSLWDGTRGSGPDEACFLDRDMFAELISDSGAVHVSAWLQMLILQNKGLDRVVLITDASTVYDDAPEDLAKKYDDLNFNSLRQLSGSHLTMAQACRNIMTHTNCGIAQAFLLASRNPARAIGMDREIGTIEAGKRANLVFTDDTFRIQRVMLEGEFPLE